MMFSFDERADRAMRAGLRAMFSSFVFVAMTGCDDTLAIMRPYTSYEFDFDAYLPGSVTLVTMEDGCISPFWCSSTEELDQIVNVEILDEGVFERSAWNRAHGGSFETHRLYPIRAVAPGTTLLRMAGTFDDGTTRTAELQLTVAEAVSFTADIHASVAGCGVVHRFGPTNGEGLVRRVFVDEEIAVTATAWGIDESGQDVRVGGDFDVPEFIEVQGVAHTIAPIGSWPPNPLKRVVQIHERGEVTLLSALPEVRSNGLVIRAIGEADIIAFTLSPNYATTPLPVGESRFIEVRPFDAEGEICGRAPFIERMEVVSTTPEVCLLRNADGRLLADGIVRARPGHVEPPTIEAYGLKAGICMLRMKLPDMASWDEHAIDVRTVAPNDG